MHFNFLGLAIPFFITLMLLEYLVARKKKLPYFSLHNSIANISIGIAERLTDVLVAGLFYFVYDYLHRHYAIFDIQPGIALWILLLLSTDFLWYWYHRLAHEINVLWLVHVVHHQSEDFNYTVSARITVFQAVARTAFWSILPIIGFPAHMITALLLLHGLYPFFIHTRVIGKLGILEYILVTPSHHRVHHARNEKYLDKNYGDVFIIWDKLFGTFQKEEEAPVYGLTKPLKTYSFLWQHFHFAIEMWLAVKSTPTLMGKLRIIFGKPEKISADLREEAEAVFHIRQSQQIIEQPLNRYVLVQVSLLLLALTFFIGFEHYLPPGFKASFTILVILTLINCGAIMEKKTWVFHVEVARMAVLLLTPFLYTSFAAGKIMLILTIAVLLSIYYRSAQTVYLRSVYRHKQ